MVTGRNDVDVRQRRRVEEATFIYARGGDIVAQLVT